MLNQDITDQDRIFIQKYEYNWNKQIDFTCLPVGATQEKLLIVLERIVETGESILVGWNKCFMENQK